MVVTSEVFLLNERRFGQASLRACPNAANFSKKSSLVTTMTSKTNHHASTANIYGYFLIFGILKIPANPVALGAEQFFSFLCQVEGERWEMGEMVDGEWQMGEMGDGSEW